MDRNMGFEYAEKSSKLGGSDGVVVIAILGFCVKTLMASRA
jgi:hypothetical protein